MTNYEPIKEKIWEAVKSDNKDEFNKQCEVLMRKSSDDWWRVGWMFNPKDIDEVISLTESVAKTVHKMWIDAMKCGDAPSEDVSPGESFQRCAELIKRLKNDSKRT